MTASTPADEAATEATGSGTAPGTTTGTDADGATVALVTAAAEAAAAVLPASRPLTAGQPSDHPLTIDLTGQAVHARFAGAAHGEVLAIVGPDLVEALATSSLGELDLASAVRPALEAALACWGPVVLEPPVVVESEATLMEWAARGGAVVVPLLDGQAVHAALGVSITPGPAPNVQFPAAAGVLAAAGALAAAADPDGSVRSGDGPAGQSGGQAGGLHLLYDVEMDVTAELGRTRMAVRDLLSLAPGAIIELDRAAGGPTDLLVNGRLIACGEVVVIDENFGLRITEIVTSTERE
ncbi:MAG: flagellar motor switch protein FliN [Actinobacteria bacterium]|nr:flagellar motor switch protein FliN [Actinomycetota bacterium]